MLRAEAVGGRAKIDGAGSGQALAQIDFSLLGAGPLLWIISSEDGRRTIHEIWQRAAHGYFDNVTAAYSLLWLIAIVGVVLMRSALKMNSLESWMPRNLR